MKASTLITLLQKEVERNSDAEVRFEDRTGYRESVDMVRFSKAEDEKEYNYEDQIVLSR